MPPKLILLVAFIWTAPAVADTTDTNLAAYDSNVRKVYARETRSQCLARMRRSTTEITICGAVERKDRYRTTRGDYMLPEAAIVQSPAEKFLESQTLIAQSQSTVGAGYSSSLAGIKRGYLRGSYKLVTQLVKGEDQGDE